MCHLDTVRDWTDVRDGHPEVDDSPRPRLDLTCWLQVAPEDRREVADRRRLLCVHALPHRQAGSGWASAQRATRSPVAMTADDRPCSRVEQRPLGVKHSPCTPLTTYFSRMSLSCCSYHRGHRQVVLRG